MLLTPHKTLSRPFLRRLVENRFLSPRGLEYCPEEVMDLLHEKETRLAQHEFSVMLKQRANLIDHAATIRSFQNSVMASLQRNTTRECAAEKIVSSDYAPSSFYSDTIFSLPVKSTDSLIVTQHDQHQSQGVDVNSAPCAELTGDQQREGKTQNSGPGLSAKTNRKRPPRPRKILCSLQPASKEKSMKEHPKYGRPCTSAEVQIEINKSLSYLKGLTKNATKQK